MDTHRRSTLVACLAIALLAQTGSAIPIRDPDDPSEPPILECVDNSDCDDGDDCNGAERCVGNAIARRCIGGTPRRCSDFNPCTTDSCEAGECRHESICTTPTSTTSTTVTTPSTSTTSTTLPGAACSSGDGSECNDGDPCTDDTCGDDARCTHTPAGGDRSLTCSCERTAPASCGGALPTPIVRGIDRACRLGRAATATSGKRRQRQLVRAGRIFAGTTVRLNRLAGRSAVRPECAANLAALLLDAKERAATALRAQ